MTRGHLFILVYRVVQEQPNHGRFKPGIQSHIALANPASAICNVTIKIYILKPQRCVPLPLIKKKRHITDDIDHFSNMTPTRTRHVTLASGKRQQNPNCKLSMASPSFIKEKKQDVAMNFRPPNNHSLASPLEMQIKKQSTTAHSPATK